ncbi:MAG: TIGR02391 family protein [ANME-2 cluster archaeon]|nr:TIGR02391 family protein [ANME-2 cluster archaeon]
MVVNKICKPFRSGDLEALCKVIADTDTGLTGTEIGDTLAQIGVVDTDPTMTKWRRLYYALVDNQNKRHDGNRVLSFIAKALHPTRYINKSEHYELMLRGVNTVLAFHGLNFRDDGKFHTIKPVSTLAEAEKRAQKFKTSVFDRKLHNDLLRFCSAELLQENYFHAVLEATKSVGSKVRSMTGLNSDGAQLIDDAFGGPDPVLKINAFKTDTEKSEQRGFTNLAKGLFGTFRNPAAHAPKIEWNLEEQDALDLFTLASYVLRRIDNSHK